MDADLNTSLAITSLYDVLKAKTNDATKLAALDDFDRVLSLNLLENAEKHRKSLKESEEIAERDPVIDQMIEERSAAKKNKDFGTADRIRDELKAMGVEIIDTPQGTKWKRAWKRRIVRQQADSVVRLSFKEPLYETDDS